MAFSKRKQLGGPGPGELTVLAAADTLPGSSDDSGGGADSLAHGILPAAIGKYRVLRQIGVGGMGLVFAGYDNDLDRPVAIKLLQPALTMSPESEERFRREARSMARLSHPNVVAVHEIGNHEGRTFIAMEYVAGTTLKAWQRERADDWKTILATYIAAGRGLAAAHAADIVHRDFKPDNVLVGDDGRPRVLDFGLAHSAEYPRDEHLERTLDSVGSTLPGSDTGLTVTGTVLGTPRYMAPEQFLGDELDERTDQYAFCVALYEALYGRSPYPGTEIDELAMYATAGDIVAPPSASPVPAQVRNAIRRGMARMTDDRWPSMDALLDALGAALSPPRRRRLIAAGVGIALLAGAAFVYGRGSVAAPALCEYAEAEIAAVWNDERRATAAAAFATRFSDASPSWQRVSSLLDRYAAEWSAMATQNCEATRVRGAQSERLHDLRAVCLDRSLARVSSFVALIETADLDQVTRVIDGAHTLTDLRACSDSEALLAEVAPPQDEAERHMVEETYRDLDRAQLLEIAGDFTAGLELVRALDERTQGASYDAIRAAVLGRLATLTEKSGDAQGAESLMRRAIDHAGRAGDLVNGANMWNELLWTVGYRQGRVAEALAMQPAARYAVEVADRDELRARHLSFAAVLQYMDGDAIAAKRMFEDALRQWRALGPRALRDVGNELSNLGAVQIGMQDLDAAARSLAESLAVLEQAVGPDHHLNRLPLGNLADVEVERGNFDRALALIQQAQRLERHLGADHPDIAQSHGRAGSVHLNAGDAAAAETAYRIAVDMWARLGIDEGLHPMYAHYGLGVALSRLGRLAEARTHLERARAGHARLDPDSPHLVWDLLQLAANHRSEGDGAASLAMIEEAARIAAVHQDDTRSDSVEIDRARWELWKGAPAAALARLEAVQKRQDARGDGDTRRLQRSLRGSLLFELARARWETSARLAALADAREAHALLSTSEHHIAGLVAAWLAERGVELARPVQAEATTAP